MVLMLGHHLRLIQWLALFCLFLGISLVQVENMTSKTVKKDVNPLYGLLAVISACTYEKICGRATRPLRFYSGTLSALASVYFEMILKRSDVSLWIRNIQLGVFGMFFGVLTMHEIDGSEVKENGFLYGYTNLVWLAITVQSAGGLIIALVVKHADNILKGFATSSAIILSCIVSMLLLDFQLTVLFALGSALIIFSIFLYSKPELISHVPLIKEPLK